MRVYHFNAFFLLPIKYCQPKEYILMRDIVKQIFDKIIITQIYICVKKFVLIFLFPRSPLLRPAPAPQAPQGGRLRPARSLRAVRNFDFLFSAPQLRPAAAPPRPAPQAPQGAGSARAGSAGGSFVRSLLCFSLCPLLAYLCVCGSFFTCGKYGQRGSLRRFPLPV